MSPFNCSLLNTVEYNVGLLWSSFIYWKKNLVSEINHSRKVIDEKRKGPPRCRWHRAWLIAIHLYRISNLKGKHMFEEVRQPTSVHCTYQEHSLECYSFFICQAINYIVNIRPFLKARNEFSLLTEIKHYYFRVFLDRTSELVL